MLGARGGPLAVELAQSIKCRSQVHYTLSSHCTEKEEVCKHRGLFSVHSHMHLCCISCCREGIFYAVENERERDEQRWPYFKAIQWPVVKCSTVVWCIYKTHTAKRSRQKNESRNAYSQLSTWCSLWIFRLKNISSLTCAPSACVCVLWNIITSRGLAFFHAHVSQQFWIFLYMNIFFFWFTPLESRRGDVNKLLMRLVNRFI